MDIKSFYPSLDPVRAANIAKKMWLKSSLKLENVNTEMLAKYVGKFCDKSKIREENLNEVVFTKIAKKKKFTKKIANKYKTSTKNSKKHKKTKEEVEKENWALPVRPPTKLEVRKLLGLAFERLIVVSMKNHIYQFENQNRLQNEGGATGLVETGELADVYMLWWDDEYMKLLESVQVVLDVLGRFKDDINNICEEISTEKAMKILELDVEFH